MILETVVVVVVVVVVVEVVMMMMMINLDILFPQNDNSVKRTQKFR